MAPGDRPDQPYPGKLAGSIIRSRADRRHPDNHPQWLAGFFAGAGFGGGGIVAMICFIMSSSIAFILG